MCITYCSGYIYLALNLFCVCLIAQSIMADLLVHEQQKPKGVLPSGPYEGEDNEEDSESSTSEDEPSKVTIVTIITIMTIVTIVAIFI